MTITKTKFKIAEAARITGKSPTTIRAHIDAGKISVDEDIQGCRVIDGSELTRAYGDDACDFSLASPTAKKTSNTNQPPLVTGDQIDLSGVQQLLTNERKERDREREQLQARIDHLEDSLSRSQEGHNRATLLLNDRTEGVGDLEKSFRKLEQRIANQEKAFRNERLKIKNQAKHKIDFLRQALEEEQSKTFWARLFS